MSTNSKAPQGLGSAQQNNVKHKERVHPHDQPYTKTCIIKNCRDKPYYDGMIHYSLCLSCLERTQLGPFYSTASSRQKVKAAEDLKTFKDEILEAMPSVSSTSNNPNNNRDYY